MKLSEEGAVAWRSLNLRLYNHSPAPHSQICRDRRSFEVYALGVSEPATSDISDRSSAYLMSVYLDQHEHGATASRQGRLAAVGVVITTTLPGVVPFCFLTDQCDLDPTPGSNDEDPVDK